MMIKYLRHLYWLGEHKDDPAWQAEAKRFNAAFAELFSVEERDYVANPSDAKKLIGQGWQKEVEEIEPGKFVVKLTKGSHVVDSSFPDQRGFSLPIVICIACVVARLQYEYSSYTINPG
jgi:hypothetical protein